MTAVAVLGLGSMGSGMAHALLEEGLSVTVHNRTAAKAQPLAEAGARVAATAKEAVAGADVVLLSLADEAAVEEVFLTEVLPVLTPSQLVVDTSTLSPSFAREAGERVAAHGVSRVEACVVGNPAMARAGALRVYAAGDEAAVEAAAEVLDAIGQETRYLGASGTASSLKLAFNLMLGVQTAALAEAVRLTESAGLGRDLVLDALQDTAWGSLALGFRAGFMRTRDYQPAGFRSVLMHKDLRLAQDEAQVLGVGLPVVAAAAEQYRLVTAAGRGDEDAAVVAG